MRTAVLATRRECAGENERIAVGAGDGRNLAGSDAAGAIIPL
jgi:hypothetical protein